MMAYASPPSRESTKVVLIIALNSLLSQILVLLLYT